MRITQRKHGWLVWSTILVISTASGCFLQSASSHPADADLEKRFHENRKDFDELIEMSKSDSKVVRISLDFTWLDNSVAWPRPKSELGFSEERWNQYRSVFKKLGLNEGIARPLDTDTTYLIGSTEGLVTGGSSKGYAYSAKELPTVSGSLDDYERSSPKTRPAYKRIEENWYLYYDFE